MDTENKLAVYSIDELLDALYVLKHQTHLDKSVVDHNNKIIIDEIRSRGIDVILDALLREALGE